MCVWVRYAAQSGGLILAEGCRGRNIDWSGGCEWEGGRVCRYGVANVWVINFGCAMNKGDLRLYERCGGNCEPLCVCIGWSDSHSRTLL